LASRSLNACLGTGILVQWNYLNLLIMTFLTGLIIAILGFLLIVYREKVQQLTGDIGFAEQYLGGGGTFTFFLILGVMIFIGGLMWATGTLQAWFGSSLGTYFGHA